MAPGLRGKPLSLSPAFSKKNVFGNFAQEFAKPACSYKNRNRLDA
jgi:hypothetical protein